MDSKNIVLGIMKDLGTKDALGLRTRSPKLTETEIIDEEDKIPEFTNRSYLDWKVHTPVKYDGQVWLLLQPYDATVHKDTPDKLRALWGLAHTKNPEKAKPYVAPLGVSGLYMKDECCTVNVAPKTEDGFYLSEDIKTYRSKVDSNAYSPIDYAQNWEEVILK